MMPDLGKYADAVLSSYAVSIFLLILLVAVSIRQARRINRKIDTA